MRTEQEWQERERQLLTRNSQLAIRCQEAESKVESMGKGIDDLAVAVADTTAVVCHLIRGLTNLRNYVAVEGRPDDDGKVMVGLANGSVWGPCADPAYETGELANAMEKWLKTYVDELLKVSAGNPR